MDNSNMEFIRTIATQAGMEMHELTDSNLAGENLPPSWNEYDTKGQRIPHPDSYDTINGCLGSLIAASNGDVSGREAVLEDCTMDESGMMTRFVRKAIARKEVKGVESFQ